MVCGGKPVGCRMLQYVTVTSIDKYNGGVLCGLWRQAGWL